MDTERHRLTLDAPRSGWRYGVQVALTLAELWWIPALVIVAVVLLIKLDA